MAIPLHPKDAGTARLAVSWLRRHCKQVGDVYIIGPDSTAAPPGTIFIPETSFPFKRERSHSGQQLGVSGFPKEVSTGWRQLWIWGPTTPTLVRRPFYGRLAHNSRTYAQKRVFPNSLTRK